MEENLSRPVDVLLPRLDSSFSGLGSEDAEKRLEIFGRNELARRKKRAGVFEFLLHFRSPLVIILIFAALISGFLQEFPT